MNNIIIFEKEIEASKKDKEIQLLKRQTNLHGQAAFELGLSDLTESKKNMYALMLEVDPLSIEEIPEPFKTILKKDSTDTEILEAQKYLKKKKVKKDCYDTIVEGFTSTVKYNEPRYYSLDEFSQKNIDDQMIQLQAGEIQRALWHDDSVVKHDIWTIEEFKYFFTEYKMFVLYNRLKSDILEDKISKVETLEELETIAWDNELTVEEQQEIMSTIEQMMVGV